MSIESTRKISKLLDELKRMGIERGRPVEMVKRGQLEKIRCEMPFCYCPEGRAHFVGRRQPMPPWALNLDHYPKLAMDGGRLDPWNIRLAHVRCNLTDFGWRSRIRRMIEKGLSLAEMADALNRKGVLAPYAYARWTPALVRKAYTS